MYSINTLFDIFNAYLAYKKKNKIKKVFQLFFFLNIKNPQESFTTIERDVGERVDSPL